MTLSVFIYKVKSRLWGKLVRYSRNQPFYPCLYRSYWHYKLCSSTKTTNTTCYYAARPNSGAGIGHQLANWIAGYWFAKQFGLKFAHLPFSNQKWEDFLGFGEGEQPIKELVNTGYKLRKLPLFNEYNSQEVVRIKAIIQSYAGKKIVFLAEQDQFYRDQFGVMDDIKHKFHHAKSRTKDKLIYSKENFNIAIHVRRGDIVVGQQSKNPNLLMRWQNNNYFTKVLTTALEKLKTNKPVSIYLFSQGEIEDFQDFKHFQNMHFCLDMDAQDSFLHLVYADLLITSKSSFSYKPALLSDGIKICPADFWHGYPDDKNWILVENDETFDAHRNTTHRI
ncbi:MAG: hypothetical protein EZS26_000279 [Candidatus Ordinivivax streblomastigis]|uniref:Glycosyl transferase family 11 n=1 Tax=Candidatus Ordinivivax streblomastigis TaxID=2540710 RepID=A0A5M8P5W9_9BACT|nr:MAG: hypothetical protein EZS26_000279 [Candidatus Ordinivivax streblomastigis]